MTVGRLADAVQVASNRISADDEVALIVGVVKLVVTKTRGVESELELE